MEHKQIHSASIVLDGKLYQVQVYCLDNGRHFAETRLDDGDLIINDASSFVEVIQKHIRVLPVAISARELLRCKRSDTAQRDQEAKTGMFSLE